MAVGKKVPKKDNIIIEKTVLEERSYKFNFIRNGKWASIISMTFIAVGIIMFIIRGFNFGIDFLGGNMMEIKFKNAVEITEVRKVMEDIGYGKSILQSTAPDQYIIRTTPITAEEKTLIIDSLDEKIGVVKPLVQDRQVAAGFSKTITRNTLIAVAISLAGIMIYIWIRFAVRFALISILELLHDLLLVLSFYAITYREFNTTTIAVILTILGYSVNDAIIIFDRVREELRINKRDKFINLTNYAINKTMGRSIGTVATTLFPIIILLIIGNETLKDFAFGLFVGILSGTYSSILIGPQILIAWNNKFPKYKK